MATEQIARVLGYLDEIDRVNARAGRGTRYGDEAHAINDRVLLRSDLWALLAQAAALDEPTHTEWGVGVDGTTGAVAIAGDEAGARRLATGSMPVVARQVTEWRRVDE